MSEILKHRFYSILYDRDRNVLTLVWSDDTANMQDADFNDAALQFAKLAKAHSTPHLRIVITEFKHQPSSESMKWREINVLPLYDEAGVRKIAFEVGRGGEEFPDKVESGHETRSFETSEEIYEWFSQTDD